MKQHYKIYNKLLRIFDSYNNFGGGFGVLGFWGFGVLGTLGLGEVKEQEGEALVGAMGKVMGDIVGMGTIMQQVETTMEEEGISISIVVMEVHVRVQVIIGADIIVVEAIMDIVGGNTKVADRAKEGGIQGVAQGDLMSIESIEGITKGDMGIGATMKDMDIEGQQ